MSAVREEQVPDLLPIAACGWSEFGEARWLLVPVSERRVRALLADVLPPLPPGGRLQRRLGAAVLHAVAVGPAHNLALVVARRGYLPPLAQRAAIAAAWQRRLRFAVAAWLPHAGGPDLVFAAALRTPSDVLAARQWLRRHALAAGFAAPGDIGLCVAATEAMVNALRHAGGGRLQVRAAPDRLSVEVEDRGPGLPFARLAEALLAPRDPASPCRGRGFWLMLTYAQHCEVVTGPRGTRVRLEFARRPAG